MICVVAVHSGWGLRFERLRRLAQLCVSASRTRSTGLFASLRWAAHTSAVHQSDKKSRLTPPSTPPHQRQIDTKVLWTFAREVAHATEWVDFWARSAPPRILVRKWDLLILRPIIEGHHGRLPTAVNDWPRAGFAFSIPLATDSATESWESWRNSDVCCWRTPSTTQGIREKQRATNIGG